jgi:hypothetical protein
MFWSGVFWQTVMALMGLRNEIWGHAQRATSRMQAMLFIPPLTFPGSSHASKFLRVIIWLVATDVNCPVLIVRYLTQVETRCAVKLTSSDWFLAGLENAREVQGARDRDTREIPTYM